MRPISAHILLSLFLFAALVPQQVRADLERLPMLIKHYKEHKAEDGSITVFRFLSMHYGEQYAGHRQEHGGHDSLPFKCDKHGHAGAEMPPLMPPDRPAAPDHFFRLPERQPRVFQYAGRAPSVETSDIWQPPRA